MYVWLLKRLLFLMRYVWLLIRLIIVIVFRKNGMMTSITSYLRNFRFWVQLGMRFNPQCSCASAQYATRHIHFVWRTYIHTYICTHVYVYVRPRLPPYKYILRTATLPAPSYVGKKNMQEKSTMTKLYPAGITTPVLLSNAY